MRTNTRFPVFRWVGLSLTGRWARRIYLVLLIILLLATTAARLRSYLMARKIQAVLRGLAEIRLDQTTEQELANMVPYLTRKEWSRNGSLHRTYWVQISNESDRLPQILSAALNAHPSEQLSRAEDWLGYRYIRFDASVTVEDGKVKHVEYGLANQWVRPLYPVYVGYIVAARSVHGFWMPHNFPFNVTSQQDYSPKYHPGGGKDGLSAIYTNDAPPNLTERVFKLNLSCFWRLRGCTDAREIAPALWQDLQAIREDTYQQLISGKCPDSIVEGRMRYLPDVSILLLEVTGSKRIEVNEEGDRSEDWFTDYKLIQAIRGPSFGSWKNIRFRRTIPALDEPSRRMANQIWPETKVGTQVLYFGNPNFYSCRFIPATPSAIEIVRTTPVPPKKPEDEIPVGLQ